MTSILLIDDDEDILFIAATRLERMGGFSVMRASGGKEALRTLESQIPDAILMDYMMPDIDGSELMRELKSREHLRSIPVIFFSAKADPASVEHFIELGAKGVISKPFDGRELPDTIERILSS